MTPDEAIAAVKVLRDSLGVVSPREVEALGLLLKDAATVNRLNMLLSADEWPGASGMEDICEIVRYVRLPVEGAPEWHRH